MCPLLYPCIMNRTRTKPTFPVNYKRIEVASWNPALKNVYPNGYPTYSVAINDVNNRRQRPESPCTHTKTIMIHEPYPTYTIGGWRRSGECANIPATTLSTFLVALAGDRIGHITALMNRSFYDRRARLAERTSTLNMLNELRDVGSMFKDLRKYRFIDWEFGWKPFLSDLSNIQQQHDSVIEKINGRLDQLRVPVSEKRRFDTSFNYDSTEFSFGPGQKLGFSFVGKISVAYQATFFPIVPKVLSNLELNQARLDMQGWNIDLATAWEAMPFSWLVDWFIPIGDSLESLSGTNLNIPLDIVGRISFTCQGTFEFWSVANDGRPKGVTLGGGTFKHYRRMPLSTRLFSSQALKPEFKLPLPDARKAALLNDIWGVGSSEEDSRRLRRKANRADRKVGEKLGLLRKNPIRF